MFGSFIKQLEVNIVIEVTHFGLKFSRRNQLGVSLFDSVEAVVRDLCREGEIQLIFERSQETSELFSVQITVFVLVEVVEAEHKGLVVLVLLESESRLAHEFIIWFL